MIRVKDVAYVRFRAPDLDRMEAFLTDFGLVRSSRTDTALYMRGTDAPHHIHVTERGAPGFAGFAFWADSAEDLAAVAAMPGSSDVEAVDEPGGGHRVRLTDPDGFKVEVVHGMEELAPLTPPFDSQFNWGDSRERLGAPKRVRRSPSPIKRLGHVVLFVSDFQRSDRFYKERFGLLSSDEIHADDDPSRPTMSFNRVDRGTDYVDHHTLALLQGPEPRFHHAAFEVPDLDALVAGHEHLIAGKYKHAYGIGRHILGSQIFDYWLDPWDNRVEHWTDSDLLNAESPTGNMPLSTAMSVQWGPTTPRND